MKEFYTNIYQYGNNILVRGYKDNGEEFASKVNYEPYVFVDTDKETGYRDIHGNFVKKITLDGINDAKKYLDQYKDVYGMRIMGLTRWAYLYIFDHYLDIEPDINKVKVVSIDIEVLSDGGFAKVENADKPITAIAIRNKKTRVCFGCGEFTNKTNDKVYYIRCDDEVQLLRKFLEVWDKMAPDIITGWNIKLFDIPYIVNRIRNVLGEEYVKRLSPWRIVRETDAKGMNGERLQSYNLAGISNLDYLVIYRKFCVDPRESYKLDSICEVELGEKKTDYSEYGSLNNLYHKNHQKFIEYNLRDNDLIFMLEEKLGYIAQAMTIAYDAKVNFEDSITSVLLWDVIAHNHLLKQNIVVKPQTIEEYNESIEGAYVKEPQIGKHDWVVSFDLNSLYPNLIIQYSIGTDTKYTRSKLRMHPDKEAASFFLEKMDENDYVVGINPDYILNKDCSNFTKYLKRLNLTMTANGVLYERRNSFFSELMDRMYKDRVMYKNKMIETKKKYETSKSHDLLVEMTRYDNLQKAKKIQLNSAYGSFANKYFRWFSVANAEAITKSGQLSIRWVERDINNYLNKILETDNVDYVIAIDTDSVYVKFDSLVKKFADEESSVIDYVDKLCAGEINKIINNSYKKLADTMNATEQKMVMKRENIADKAIWLAKKKYIMNVWDSEGVRYKEPKLKMMGVEAIRSSTPTVCRKYITEAIKLIIDGDESIVQNYIFEKKKEFSTLPFDQIAFPRSVNFIMGSNRSSWEDSSTVYKKGTPIQVRGALLYNKYLRDRNLDKEYETINSGDKIKFCYMKLPNPVKENVFAVPAYLPKEFKLDQYIDYDIQYEKAFIAPMRTILDAVKWNISTKEKTATLEAFFT